MRIETQHVSILNRVPYALRLISGAGTFLEMKYGMPAEWEKHEAVWIAWPCAENLWKENLEAAQVEFRAFCAAIADDGRGEKLFVLVPDEKRRAEASRQFAGLPVQFFLIPYGDIWLRDTAPLFLRDAEGQIASLQFRFNGWGEKYVLEHDAEVSAKIAACAGFPELECDWIFEGGALEFDGEGTCLTTRQCLLNPNRNPGLSETDIEGVLKNCLGVQKVLWIENGLLNDHTDGHIDTIARFTSPGKVMIMQAKDDRDPNTETLAAIARDLASFTDAKGRKVEVQKIPSPGLIVNSENEVMPASYVNFYIANTTVTVPTYGSRFDESAVCEIAKAFPDRKVIGLPAQAILSGGGAFHCISQQQPLLISK